MITKESYADTDQQSDLTRVNLLLEKERLPWRKKRLLVIKYVLEGETLKKASTRVDRSAPWACRLVSLYRRGGLEELLKRRRRVGVSTPLLMGDQRAELARVDQLIEQENIPRRKMRLLAISRILEGGMSMEEIGDEVGRTGVTICNWVGLYRRGGLRELLREIPGGVKSLLEPSMARAMEERLLRDPRWSGKEVQNWLEEEYGLRVKLITAFKYLRECRDELGPLRSWKRRTQNTDGSPHQRSDTNGVKSVFSSMNLLNSSLSFDDNSKDLPDSTDEAEGTDDGVAFEFVAAT